MAPVQSLRGAARRLPVRAQRAPCRRRFVARRAADVQAGLDMTDIALEDPVDAQYEEDWLDEEEEDDEEYEPFDRFAGLTTETKWGFTYITELNKQLADTSDLDAIDLEYYPPWEEIWENWMGCSPEEAEVLYQEFDRLLAKYHQPMVVGDVVSGTVIHVERQGALVEIGGKAPAWAPADELSVSRVLDAAEVVRPGMVREFFIDRTYKEDLIVTLDQEEREVMWSRLRDMQEADVTLPGYVVSANLGGCVVEIEGFDVEGFVPNSHLGALQSEEREELISRELELKILDLDEEEEHVTLSARAVESAGVLENFRIGDVVAGTVSRVEPYGAFVDVGDGGNGLLHVSQISHDRVTNVEDLMTVGDQLKVMVVALERERGRLALSTKKLEPAPGDMLRDPAFVFQNAEEMARLFKIRVAAAEEAAREEEARRSAAGVAQQYGVDYGSFDDYDDGAAAAVPEFDGGDYELERQARRESAAIDGPQ